MLFNSFNAKSQIIETINTANVELQSLSAVASCMGYCVVGICFWLRCTPFGCSVETTLLVSHRSPDLVVSTYKNSGGNVWAEANIISSAIGGSVSTAIGLSGGNSDTDSVADGSNSSMVFSEVDIFGGLGSRIFIADSFGALEICEDDTTFLRPYYLTPLDYLFWRDPYIESLDPRALLPVGNDVGLWGALRPRVGIIHQAEEPKACAVIAQRALHIASRNLQAHIYTNVDGYSSNALTDQWQMLYPRPEPFCSPFGFNTEHSLGLGGSKGKFVWNVWRSTYLKQKVT